MIVKTHVACVSFEDGTVTSYEIHADSFTTARNVARLAHPDRSESKPVAGVQVILKVREC